VAIHSSTTDCVPSLCIIALLDITALPDEIGHLDVHARLDPDTDGCCVTLTDEPAAGRPSGR